jgi:uncharacterized protein (TIGR02466 family)
MKKPKKIKHPSPAELQPLHQLFQSGRLHQAEAMAQAMLRDYRQSPALYNILGLCQQQQEKFNEALTSFRKLLSIDPRIPEVHFNLAILFTQLDKPKEAITCYRKSLQLKPDMPAAHYNLGALLQAQGQLTDAAKQYQKALVQEPGYVAALVNLGTVLQQQGRLNEAGEHYRKALTIQPDAQGHLNLGTVLYGLGQHEEAIQAFNQAISLDPNCADAWNSLGEIQRDRAQMDQAVASYKKALAIKADHDRALYNMGEYLSLADKLEQAIPYFEASTFADSRERALQCLYKTSQFERFKQKFDTLSTGSRHNSILLGALASHYATNFHQPNHYQFCPMPMDYVLHTRLEPLTRPDSPLLQELLHDITHLAIAERKQGRLYYGMQSAGNLLLRSEHSFQQLAGLLTEKINTYRKHYAGSKDRIIKDFPKQISFTSSWYLRMKQGGYLTSHIHEEGWISGCVYLQLPDRINDHEGSFAYSTDGDDYPRLHDDFPSQIVDVQVGDLVLFPSSLFHRTLPFQSDQERVCVAFDISP